MQCLLKVFWLDQDAKTAQRDMHIQGQNEL